MFEKIVKSKSRTTQPTKNNKEQQRTTKNNKGRYVISMTATNGRRSCLGGGVGFSSTQPTRPNYPSTCTTKTRLPTYCSMNTCVSRLLDKIFFALAHSRNTLAPGFVRGSTTCPFSFNAAVTWLYSTASTFRPPKDDEPAQPGARTASALRSGAVDPVAVAELQLAQAWPSATHTGSAPSKWASTYCPPPPFARKKKKINQTMLA